MTTTTTTTTHVSQLSIAVDDGAPANILQDFGNDGQLRVNIGQQRLGLDDSRAVDLLFLHKEHQLLMDLEIHLTTGRARAAGKYSR